MYLVPLLMGCCLLRAHAVSAGAGIVRVELSQQSLQQSICPGDEVVYRCTAPGNGVIWGTPVGEFVILEAFEPPSRGGFLARRVLYDSTNNCLTSNLTFSTSENRTVITCENTGRSLQSSAVIDAEGIPSAPTLLPLTEDSVRETGDSNIHSLTLHWTLPILFPNRIFRYIFNVTPPAPPCGSSCEVRLGQQSFTRRDYQFMLTLGQRHTLSLRADNCEDNVQSSPQSNVLEVFLQVPSAPLSCNSTPLYSQPSGSLLTIDTTWTAVPSPGIPRELTLPDLSIQHYQLVFLNGRSDQQIVQMCAGQLCSHTHSGSAGASSEGYSVAVAAQNMVGLGDTRNCTSQPISLTNNLLSTASVAVASSDGGRLSCAFLSGFTESAHCRVQYGTDPTRMNLPYSAESNETGTAGDTVHVCLTERLNSSTTYYYNASASSGSIHVVVLGSFATSQFECELSDLQLGSEIANTPSTDQRCETFGDSVASVHIEHGVVCYSGTTVHSIALYICDQGYLPSAIADVRVCRNDGTWSGSTTICISSGTLNNDLVVIGIALAGVVLFTAGCLLGALLFYCISKLCNKKRPSKEQEVVQQQAAAEPVPEYEEVGNLRSDIEQGGKMLELHRNLSYGHVQQ